MKLAHLALRGPAWRPPTTEPHPEPPVPAAPPQPLLIVADDYHLACRYARQHDLGGEGTSWRYVYNVEHIQGADTPGRYVTLSTGKLRGRELQVRVELGQYLRATGWTYGR